MGIVADQIIIPGTERHDACPERDIRYTPAWCTRMLLENCPPLRRMTVVEPAAGNGAIVDLLVDSGYEVLPIELRQECIDVIMKRHPSIQAVCGDWFVAAKTLPMRGLSIVTNPPYSLCPVFVETCLNLAPKYCAMLLRLNHLGSATWHKFWMAHPPTNIIVLSSRRPSFSSDGKTDASEYAWFVWLRRTAGSEKSSAVVWFV